MCSDFLLLSLEAYKRQYRTACPALGYHLRCATFAAFRLSLEELARSVTALHAPSHTIDKDQRVDKFRCSPHWFVCSSLVSEFTNTKMLIWI